MHTIDINECKQAPPPCDQLCRNDKGSFQCYCKDGYELNETTSLCQSELQFQTICLYVHQRVQINYMCILGKYKDCSELPDLPNGEVDCNDYITGKLCDLTCHDGYAFTTNEDPSPQYCIDSQWSYQKRQRAFPTCQGVYFFTTLLFFYHVLLYYILSLQFILNFNSFF